MAPDEAPQDLVRELLGGRLDEEAFAAIQDKARQRAREQGLTLRLKPGQDSGQ